MSTLHIQDNQTLKASDVNEHLKYIHIAEYKNKIALTYSHHPKTRGYWLFYVKDPKSNLSTFDTYKRPLGGTTQTACSEFNKEVKRIKEYLKND